jgi:hypothetical protein
MKIKELISYFMRIIRDCGAKIIEGAKKLSNFFESHSIETFCNTKVVIKIRELYEFLVSFFIKIIHSKTVTKIKKLYGFLILNFIKIISKVYLKSKKILEFLWCSSTLKVIRNSKFSIKIKSLLSPFIKIIYNSKIVVKTKNYIKEDFSKLIGRLNSYTNVSINDDYSSISKELEEFLPSFIGELYRLPSIFDRIILKVNESEQNKYRSQFNWFKSKADEFMRLSGYTISNIVDLQYDSGMIENPLNIADFSKDDDLVVGQIIEPTILKDGRVVKPGVIILKKEEK